MHPLVIRDALLVGAKCVLVRVFDDFQKLTGPIQTAKQSYTHTGNALIERNGSPEIRRQVAAGWLATSELEMQNQVRANTGHERLPWDFLSEGEKGVLDRNQPMVDLIPFYYL